MNTPNANTHSSAAPAPYSTPTTGAAIDLFLDANEGPGGIVDVAQVAAALKPDVARRYAGPIALERDLAASLALPQSRVLVTAGGDEAIDRACRTFLGPGKELILPVPTFEMIGRYANQVGATVVTTPWNQGAYPIERVLELINPRTAMIAVVTPNNPTGAVASAEDLRRLSAAAPDAVLLVDLAYTEFADLDLTSKVLELPNAIAIRTFSKAFGLAGLRVGYALGPERLIQRLRANGSPFPVSTLSLAVAAEALRLAPASLPGVVARVREERTQLQSLLQELGARALPSQGNFVLAEFTDADWVWRALASVGIGVRRYKPEAGLDRWLRITCPGSAASFERLCNGLRQARRPASLVVDIAADQARPDGPLDAFFSDREIDAIRSLQRRVPLSLVTRSSELDRWLDQRGLRNAFSSAGAETLSTSAWIVTDSPNTVRAAIKARRIPIGIAKPGTTAATELREAGAARVIESLTSLEQLLP